MLSPYLIFASFCFVWRQMSSQGFFRSSGFFINNFRSVCDKASSKEPLWWHWAHESTDMRFSLPSWSYDLRGFDLPLEVSLYFNLHQTKSISFEAQKVYYSSWLDEMTTMVPILCLCDHFWWSNEPKTETRLLDHCPDLWGVRRLTVDLKHQSGVPVAASRNGWQVTCSFFRVAPAQLGAKRRRGS